jgi:hypothetical protein
VYDAVYETEVGEVESTQVTAARAEHTATGQTHRCSVGTERGSTDKLTLLAALILRHLAMGLACVYQVGSQHKLLVG